VSETGINKVTHSSHIGLQIYNKMDDLGKQFIDFKRKAEQSLRKFPLLAANEAQNFFLDSFKRQAWIGQTTEVWKSRKPSKKREGAALLVKSGRMKRGTRIKRADWNSTIVANDTPYAGVHNEGFRGVYTRTASRRVKTKGSYKRMGDEKKRATKTRIMGVTHKVHQNMPRRRFMGNSPYLNRNIDRIFILQLSKIK